MNAHKVHRDNVQAESVEEYYRVTLCNEFLSHIIAELEERFTNSPTHTIGLLQLLQSKCISTTSETEIPEELAKAVDFYQGDLPHVVMLPVEYRKWVAMWKEPGCNVPNKLVDALKECDNITFPNIHTLLQITLTLPITSCECERSFSQLKLIKTSPFHYSCLPADWLVTNED